MSDEILRFIEPVYRFCLKRLSSHADAEDLAQEILLCVLQGLGHAEIRNIDGYVWKIAHNRYARMLDARERDVTVLCGDEYLSELPVESGEEDEAEESVFRALHTLSAMYRDILVGYYVHRLDVRALAKQHGISAETVKWRLHAGREKIRERMDSMEKTYERIKMHVMCNGSFGPEQYLDTQLYKAIAMACYASPLTIEEISLATGVPTLYLEDALEHMIWGDAMEKTGQKYATAFIITNEAQNAKMQAFLREGVVKEAADTILRYMDATRESLKGIGFYGADFPLSRLLHVLIPALVYATAERVRENSERLPKERPPRKDGGNGWFIVNEGIERLDDAFAGCNQYSYDGKGGRSGRFVYYWVGGTHDSGLDETLHDARFFIDSIGRGGACRFADDTQAAKAFAGGLCERRDGAVYPAIPIFTGKEYAAFLAWAKGCDGMDAIWHKWIDSLFRAYQAGAPGRLADQIGGNVDGYSFNLSAFVLKDLQKRGLADMPEEVDIFTKNLLLIRG